MNWSSLSSLSFVSNIQDSFTNMAAMSTKYSTMVAELAPGFASHSLSAHIMIFVTVAAILVKLMGFTFGYFALSSSVTFECDQKRI